MISEKTTAVFSLWKYELYQFQLNNTDKFHRKFFLPTVTTVLLYIYLNLFLSETIIWIKSVTNVSEIKCAAHGMIAVCTVTSTTQSNSGY